MSDVAPFEIGNYVRHPVRGVGMVVHVFRQTMGRKEWVCWVTFFKGEQHAFAAEHLERTSERPALPNKGDGKGER